MMEKDKKHIIGYVEDKVLCIDKKDIEQYLSEVKEAVENDRYRLDRNARRQDNINLFLEYVINEAKVKEILSGIEFRINRRPSSLKTADDFKGINWDKKMEHGKFAVCCKVQKVEENKSPETCDVDGVTLL